MQEVFQNIPAMQGLDTLDEMLMDPVLVSKMFRKPTSVEDANRQEQLLQNTLLTYSLKKRALKCFHMLPEKHLRTQTTLVTRRIRASPDYLKMLKETDSNTLTAFKEIFPPTTNKDPLLRSRALRLLDLPPLKRRPYLSLARNQLILLR